MLKHVGRIGDRKVVVLFREVPEQEHMALVVYTETLPAAWHDAFMKVIEDAPAQQAEEVSEVLARNTFPDGRVMLHTLHQEGMIKRVQSEFVLMTPSTGHPGIRLDELNKLIKQIKAGGESAEKLAELDANAGLAKQPPLRDAAGRKAVNQPAPAPTSAGALDDSTLANNLLSQAAKMESEAKGLLAESARLRKEAEGMAPSKPATTRGRKKAAVTDAAQ